MTETKSTDKPITRVAAEAVDRAASEAARAGQKMSSEALQLSTKLDSSAKSTNTTTDLLPNTTINHNSPEDKNFDNPSDHSEVACTTVKNTHQLSDASRAEFEKGIALADGLDQETIEKNFQKMQTKLDSEIPDETKKLCQDLSDAQDAALRKLPVEKQHEFAELADKITDAKTAQEQDALKAEMKKLAPDAVAAHDKIEQLIQPHKEDIDKRNLYLSLSQQKVLTRLDYIRALNQFGTPDDKARAQTMLAETTAIATQGSSPGDQAAQISALNAAAHAPF